MSVVIFQQARKFLSDKKFEEAIDMLSALLESLVAQHGETSIETARAYYEYGNALLTKVEDTPSEGLLGAAADEAKASASLNKILSDQVDEVDEDSDNDDSEGGEGQNDSGEEDGLDENDDDDDDADDDDDEGQEEGDNNNETEGGGGGDETPDDLQIAWELFEVARKIYEENPGPDTDIRLCELYIRLGDVQRVNNLYDDSIKDYKKALELCDLLCKPSDRLFSDIHYALAITYIYKSGQTDMNKTQQKKMALEHYLKAKECIEERLKELHNGNTTSSISSSDIIIKSYTTKATSSSSTTSSSSSSSSSSNTTSTTVSDVNSSQQTSTKSAIEEEINDTKELIDELTETIDALQKEIELMIESNDESMGIKYNPHITTNTANTTTSSSSSSSSSNSSSNTSSNGFNFPSSTTTIGFGTNNGHSSSNGNSAPFMFPSTTTTTGASVPNFFGTNTTTTTTSNFFSSPPVVAKDEVSSNNMAVSDTNGKKENISVFSNEQFPTNTLQIKRKIKPMSNDNNGTVDMCHTTDNILKKPKLD